MRRNRDKALVTFGFCILILSACVLRPEWQRLAGKGGLNVSWIETGNFRHLRLQNGRQGSHLRIYVEGDGVPWIRENRVAVDPTPPNPVLLRLMLGDGGRAVYLGRPCYFGTATERGCDELLWTFDRIGQTVIDSMCAAANDISRELGAESVQLVGFSGGGAVVVGMSRCTERLHSITTVAGNLDPVAWAAHHGYSQLAVTQIPIVAVAETHWQCESDRNVPPEVTDRYFASRPEASRHIVGDCTHATGWEKYWAQIIGVSPAN